MSTTAVVLGSRISSAILLLIAAFLLAAVTKRVKCGALLENMDDLK